MAGEKHTARHESEVSKVRISIASLVPKFRIQGWDGDPVFFGLIRPGTEDKVQALGGGVTLTKAGREYLESKHGATKFENEHEMDARFVVPEDQVEEVLRFFAKPDPQYFEISPLREMLEELTTKEHENFDPVLTAEDVQSISFSPIDISRQPPPEGEQEEVRKNPGKRISRRIFYRYQMVVPHEVFKKLQASGLVRFFRNDEVASTKGGSRVGTSWAGRFKIADNIYL